MTTLHLELPDEILQDLKIPPEQAEGRLLLELAVQLYREGIASGAAVCKLAGLSREEFWSELVRRGVPRHYGSDDLRQDVEFAGG